MKRKKQSWLHRSQNEFKKWINKKRREEKDKIQKLITDDEREPDSLKVGEITLISTKFDVVDLSSLCVEILKDKEVIRYLEILKDRTAGGKYFG